jgi:hypothetical protein
MVKGSTPSQHGDCHVCGGTHHYVGLQMTCLPTSLQTEAGSLHQASGAASASGLGCFTSQQQLIIPSPMVWWSVHTGKLRMPCAPLRSRVASTPPLGSPRLPCGSKRGLSHLFSGAGVWSCPYSPWAVPCSNGAVSCRLRQGAPVFNTSSYKAGFVRGGRGLGSGEADEGEVRVREARRRGAALGPPVPCAVQGAAGREQVLHHQPRRPRGHGFCDRLKPHLSIT